MGGEDCKINAHDVSSKVGEWKLIPLKAICSKIGSGATPTGGSSVYLDKGEVSLIRSQNIYNEGFKSDGLVYLSSEAARKLDTVRVDVGDVLLNITGDSVARVCLPDPEFLPARVNQHVAIIRPDPSCLDYRFLRYFLASPNQQAWLLSLASAGATRPALTKVMIEGLEIPLPPLPEQKAIAELLGSLDDKIELNRKQNATLEAMAQALFQSWFVDFDPVIDKALAAGHEIPEPLAAKARRRAALGTRRKPLPEAIAALFPDRFVETQEMGWVPEGWEVGKVMDLSERIHSGGTPKRDRIDYWEGGDIPWLTSGEIRQNMIIAAENFISNSGLTNSSAKWLPVDSTVVAMYGATAGQIALLSTSLTTNQAVCGIVPIKGARYYIYLHMARNATTLSGMARGSAQQNISKGIIESFQILKPENELLQRFDFQVSTNIQKWASNLEQTQTLSTLRETLLPKLISGELRLPAAEATLSSHLP